MCVIALLMLCDSLPCTGSYTMAHSGAYECRGTVGTSAGSSRMYKCVDGSWILHQV
jgi:hypothetical protein